MSDPKSFLTKIQLITLLIVLLISACQAETKLATDTPSPAPSATPTSTVTSTYTPIPTATPVPTFTPIPTATPVPTFTPPPDISTLNPVTVCAVGCDFTTIQAAIDDAGTVAGDIIYVTDAVHTEAGIMVNKDVAIQGQGAEHTIVQAHENVREATDRVFFIAKETTVSIKAMTIQNGNPTDEIRYGGGILNQGALTLAHSTVRNNRANCGGGVVSQGGTLKIVNSTISHNTADGEARTGLDCGSGGGIKLVEGGTLTLINSTLSHNQAKKNGGGLHISCESAATLTNCTISQNQARRVGGGINVGGVLTLSNCTISQNTAQGISPFQRFQGKAGGGIAVSGTLNYENTLIANHLKNSGDCVLRSNGVIGVNAHNLVEDNGCSPTYSGDPMLGGLVNNGGDTQTHALLPGSPAIDAVPADNCTMDFDQRGSPRPIAQTSTTNTPCDIGAFELQPE